ncbi:Uncharacterized protein ALO59_05261 [Pseudomonas amygdali pv. mellea]|nr:Uncharacterized protein ALO51_05044 [Pseudomonas amygdali]KPX78648.1 Uncharacterized protein ALO59_05261 [Pseudomonas amygdali pv. mellea]
MRCHYCFAPLFIETVLFSGRAQAAADTFEDYVMPVARHGLDRQTAEYRSPCISECYESARMSGAAKLSEQMKLR